MSEYMPELGQLGFSNTPWQEIVSPGWMDVGLEQIAFAITVMRGEDPDGWSALTSNSGGEPYESDVFAMRSYCWCDGTAEGHEDGCPPNFEYKPGGLIVNWYKHSSRGRSQNEHIRAAEWARIVRECLDDVHQKAL